MNASKNARLRGAPDQSGNFSTISKLGTLVSASLLVVAVLFSGGSAQAQNMLINPGAETGDLTGWNQSPSGYKYAVSTNQFIPNSGNSNYLAHSGAYTFQLFDTTADTSYIYQDFPAIAGSQWSASSYIIGYAANYFGGRFISGNDGGLF